jgi:CubicO group peptidase (beta-lactamase class C family)
MLKNLCSLASICGFLLACFLPSVCLTAEPISFQAADAAVARFMEQNEIHAAALAISREGRLLHERAFGFANAELTVPLSTEVRMRIASVSKPITAAALKYLVRDGKFKLSDPVMKFLTRYPAPTDERWKDITVGEVVQHMGGWDRSVSGDPMFKHSVIMKDLKTNSLSPSDVVRWMMTQHLDFKPGSKSVYSNFGYCLLGVLIQEISGRSYAQFVESTVARDAKMTSLTLSSTRLDHRNRNETWYDFGSEGEHFLIEPMEAHGGWVCTAADLTRFMDEFWLNGEPRSGGHGNWFFYGSLPGTTSVAVERPDGVNYALLLNKRDPEGAWNDKLKTILDAAIGDPTR